MKLRVEYKDSSGQVINQEHKLTRIAFAKHLAVAGQGYAPRPQKFMKTIGMFLHYSNYIQRRAFNEDRFSEPPIPLSDPTEKGQFSNLAGKAIADFLSKRIDQSSYTVNYEAAMRMRGMPIAGSRPDLFAFNSNGMFALEAKGFSGACGNMQTHKKQSQSGAIPVNFTVACVSYNLYSEVHCKYYDPINDTIKFDDDLYRQLTMIYYKRLSEFLDIEFFPYSEIGYQGETFYEVDLFNRGFLTPFLSDTPFIRFWGYEVKRLKLILPKKIKEYAENGLERDTPPFIFDSKENSDIYIDNDRVGLRMERY
ncbi:hypothetical protein [Paenibacillus pedocola]|uniref:hypothetical protein n=1 Tax=Paenibacillus pedocola TaxID=3242193 RepID=UPI002877ACD5|nr:hypothetical protein [Paenibacillus typhae]